MSLDISRHARPVLGIFLILAVAGCGGAASSVSDEPPASVPPAAQAQASPGMAQLALPAPSTLAAGRPTAPRSAAYIEADLIKNGSDTGPGLPLNRAMAAAPAMNFSPNWTGAAGDTSAGLAYCVYQFITDSYDRNPQVRLTWALPPTDFHDSWVAVSNWVADRWDWYPGTASGRVDLPSIDEYFNASGMLYVVVLCSGTGASSLSSIRLGGLPPVASVTANPVSGLLPLVTTLNASGSVPVEGANLHYQWDLDGDGAYETDGGATPTALATFNTGGNFTPGVRVTNDIGASDEASAAVRAIGPWQHTIGLSDNEELAAVAADAGGNVYAVGQLRNAGGGSTYDLLLLKLSPFGELLWAKTWDASDTDWGTGVAIDSSGDVIVLGWTGNGAVTDALVQKWAPAGSLVWSRTVGDSDWQNALAIELDGADIYIGGGTAGVVVDMDVYAARLDADGNLTWGRSRSYGGTGDQASDLTLKRDAEGAASAVILLANRGESYDPNPWKVEYDLDGNFLSQQELSHPDVHKTARAILYFKDPFTDQETYYLAGNTDGGPTPALPFLLAIDYKGNCVFGTTWSGTNSSGAYNLVVDQNSNFLAIGSISVSFSGRGMLWRLDGQEGSVMSAQYLDTSPDWSILYSILPYANGVLIGGYASNAAAPWVDMPYTSDKYSEDWVDSPGTGADLDWQTAPADGTLTDITADGTLDSGGGLEDALVLYRALP